MYNNTESEVKRITDDNLCYTCTLQCYHDVDVRFVQDYKYIEILGKGGNGTVHLLEDQINKIMVAVKIIEWNAVSIDHTRRELSILQDLKHQHIVKIKFYVVKRVEMYIVMEYVRGGTLQQVVDCYKPDLADLRVWFMQLVLALEYIHDRGIIHRDVKPSNCMIDTFGILKLTDFGLALQNIDKPLQHDGKVHSNKASLAAASQNNVNREVLWWIVYNLFAFVLNINIVLILPYFL
jgi:serine/threonine protein kinase